MLERVVRCARECSPLVGSGSFSSPDVNNVLTVLFSSSLEAGKLRRQENSELW